MIQRRLHPEGSQSHRSMSSGMVHNGMVVNVQVILWIWRWCCLLDPAYYIIT